MKRISFIVLICFLVVLLLPICAEAASFTLPSQLVEIESEAFRGNYAVDSVVLPEGLIKIGQNAFSESGVRSITIPASVETIAENAFANCRSDLKAAVVFGSYAHKWCLNHGVLIRFAGEADPVPTITTGGTTAAISTYGASARYRFVPTVSGTYSIASSGSTDTRCYLYDEYGTLLGEDDDSGEDLNFCLTYQFTANTVYYFRVCFYSSSVTGSIPLVLSGDSGPKVTQQPSGQTRTCGSAASFSVTATGNGTLSYQWQEMVSGSSAWQNTSLSGSTSATLSFGTTPWQNGNRYRCIITDAIGSTASTAAKLTVSVPTITTGNTTASISAAGASAWYRFTPSKTGSYTFTSSSTSDTKAYLFSAEGTQLAYNDDGGEGTNFLITYDFTANTVYYFRVCFYSSSATGNIPLVLSGDSGPKITQQPSGQTRTCGSAASFSVTATGSGTLSYQWQEMVSGSSTWQNTSLSGSTSATLSFGTTPWQNGNRYRCIITDAVGSTASAEASLTVSVPTITAGNTTASISTAGASVWYRFTPSKTGSYSFTSSSTSDTKAYLFSSSGAELTYDDDGGEGTNFLITYDLTANTVYYFRVFFYNSSVTGSIPLVLSGNFGPKITQQPTGVTTENGKRVVFSVTATGSGTLSYQWQEKVSGSSTWQNASLSGAKTSTLNFYAYTSQDGNKYRCIVTDSSGSTTSSEVTLRVTNTTRYRALLIGNDAYTTKPLDGCINDADSMRMMLTGLANSFTCTQRSNLTAAGIKSAITSAFSGAAENDVSLFYYSGHGMGGSSSDPELGALVGVNYSSSYPNDYLTTSALASELSKIPGRIIVILDSCHSGASIGKGLQSSLVQQSSLDSFNQSVIDAFSAYDTPIYANDLKSGEMAKSKFVVITACKQTETSNTASVSGKGCSIFTFYLIDGCGSNYLTGEYFGSMPADTSSDMQLTVYETYYYTKTKSQAFNPGQTAQFYAANSGEILFKR